MAFCSQNADVLACLLLCIFANFGDYKDNKVIKKLWNLEFVLSNALPGWLGSDERWINPKKIKFKPSLHKQTNDEDLSIMNL